ncbi:MAG: hypothetical protein J7639_00885 [Paenibacillaceae bacterium]|nr:hypothetical protein [Paenibacillaceae bacterium]
MATLLFLDDHHLNLSRNVERRIGRPQRLDDYTYRDPLNEIAWGYPTVFRDEASGKWRMTYQHCSTTFPRIPLLAESDDGLRWHPRDTTQEAEIAGRLRVNQLLPVDAFSEWSTTVVDPYAPPEERYKGLVVEHTSRHFLKSHLWVSPDGVRWTERPGTEWQRIAGDPLSHAFWNEARQSYTFLSRPDWTDRRLTVFETKDWRTFSEPELALQADALDTPLANLYGMPVFPYEGIYIGFLWVYHPSQEVKGFSPHKFLGGNVDCQLAYSLNGRHFMRGLRTPFVPNGEPGEPDAGCVYPSHLRQLEDGSLLLYASASTHEHAMPGATSIVTYALRRDGFAYLRSSGGAGTVGTKPLLYRGGDIELNVQSQGGYAKAQLTDWSGRPLEGYTFDDCVPFSGDDSAWKPQWQGGKRVDELAGQAIRVEVELLNARLYAIRGEIASMYAGQCWRYVHEGIEPLPRSGF